MATPDGQRAVYVISVAAEMAGVHPQTLRMYERKRLLDPYRVPGGARRYSDADMALVRRIQELTYEGLNLEGVKRVLALEAEVARLEAEIGRLNEESRARLEKLERSYRRDLVPLRQETVPWKRRRP